jgi:16S rRNA (uracil1498-N3)-methyltransferase
VNLDNLFYSTQIYDETIVLPKNEAFHAIKVLRKKIGDKIKVVDGQGNLYHTTIDSEALNDCRLIIESVDKDYGSQNYIIHVAISPPKSHDRIELFIEKAVEIGIQEISFILTDHSERNNIKLNRIYKSAISAMKQSFKANLPQINDIISIADFISNCRNSEKYIALLKESDNTHLINSAPKGTDYCIIVGAEGDFSTVEIDKALELKFKPVSLGNNRLRTETAAIAACHILNLVNEIND